MNGNGVKRVVITGLGIVSPYGIGVDKLWNSLMEGKSAIDRVTAFDTTGFDCQIGAEVKAEDFKPEDFISKKEIKRFDRFLIFSKVATKLCMEDSGIQVTDDNRYDIGAYIGSGIGGMKIFEDTHTVLVSKGPSRVSPFFIPMMLSNMASSYASIDFGIKGPNMGMVTACATGAHNVGMAAQTIRLGQAKMMMAGGAEATITPLAYAGFASMKAVSNSNDEPRKASRPFDARRNGFVMGEGSCILMLEDLDHALERGAKIYGEIVGFGMSVDAYHMTQPHPEGLGAIHAMKNALKDAGIEPQCIDYINAHGTATPLGDIAETNAIKQVFGEHARKLAISSTKSMIGHLLGSAGAIEAAIAMLATKHNMLPPTINYEFPDPQCDLDYVPNVARAGEVNYAISNSFGFGGQNAVIVMKKYV